MKTVEQLAREAGFPERRAFSDLSDLYPRLERFHDAAIAQYRESLLAGVGEAVAWQFHDDGELGYVAYQSKPPTPEKIAYLKKWDRPAWEPLYTADQMAAAVSIERERCAAMAEAYTDGDNGDHESHGYGIAAAIRGQ